MADEDKGSQRDDVMDFVGAVVLGLTTSLAAFAAYESSLWGGNQATAYTQATITLGEANRELLHSSQERSFDTSVWLEHMKATQPAAHEVKPGDGHDVVPAVAESEGPPQTKEQVAAELAEDLTEIDDLPLAKKLDKLLATRLELTAALKWADEQHTKQTKKMPKEKRLELARQLVSIADKEEKIGEAQYAIIEKLGVADGTDDEIDKAIAANANARGEIAKLDVETAALQVEADKLLDKLAKPVFFDSPTYEKAKERKYLDLVAKGNQLFLDGQTFNSNGDNYTLATVFYTVSLFFAGLSAMLKKFPIKAAFLGLGIAIAIGATIYMLRTPFA